MFIMISKNKRMTKDRIWFNTIQAAFILNTTDRTIRTRAKNHLKDSEMDLVLKDFGFAGYATSIDAFALLNASLLFDVQLIGLQNLYFLLQVVHGKTWKLFQRQILISYIYYFFKFLRKL